MDQIVNARVQELLKPPDAAWNRARIEKFLGDIPDSGNA
jgi:hypothetical protein